MSIARLVGKAALVGSLLVVAHNDAHALARKTEYRMQLSERRTEVHPEPKRGYVIDWRATNTRAAFFKFATMTFLARMSF